MAIPTVLRRADFPTIDFTASDRPVLALDILIAGFTRLGWNLEFQVDNDENDKAVVFSNNGSGYMIKISVTSSTQNIIFETAQSWSSIDTPVNKLVDQNFAVEPINSGSGDFIMVGDDERLFFIVCNDITSTANNTKAFFIGDIVPVKPTDPYTFLFIGQFDDAVNTGSTGSSSVRGLIFDTLSAPITSAGSNQGVTFGQSDGTLSIPDGVNFFSYSYGSNDDAGSISINVDEINAEQPVIFLPTYIVNANTSVEVDGTTRANHFRGILPGLHASPLPSFKVANASIFSTITISGVNFLIIPSRSSNGYPSMGIALDDWSLLI